MALILFGGFEMGNHNGEFNGVERTGGYSYYRHHWHQQRHCLRWQVGELFKTVLMSYAGVWAYSTAFNFPCAHVRVLFSGGVGLKQWGQV